MNYRIILLVALTATACAREKSPFALWDMHAGMPFTQLDSIAVHDQQERFTCMATYGSYRQCTLTPRGVPGRMIAVIDSTDRVAIVSFHPDVLHMDMNTGAGLVLETEGLRRRWGRVSPASATNSADARERTETWYSEDRKFSAQIRWANSSYPVELTTSDEKRARPYRKLQMTAFADSIINESRSSLGGVAGNADVLNRVKAELTRLLAAQDAHRARTHRFAATLEQLHFIPRDSIELAINGASDIGWWATGRHAALRARACVIWEGAPPDTRNAQDVRLGGTAKQPDCAETAL